METIEKERWLLAKERIEEIAREPEIDGTLGIYFQKTPSNLEVTETIIIYTESMEEIQ